ncbi:Protein CYCLOPS, variant 2 [Stylosanthes scabra]|uniref:Protein CYCLOPS, variant 2 n=1 Tax=Stylosanthes scabra TaxID=79078 RepID=A0ABU6TGA8_9FABA|nr:Protein CYCLOPS, variant 2 [Stylosanthes scabra]
MEMEGRGFSGLYKNTSDELFLKTVIESPIGMPVPTMETLGFKNVSQSFRADSEELFKRWLTNGEVYNSSSMGLNRRLSKRVSTELANVSNQQHVGVISEERSNDKSYVQNNNPLSNDVSGDFNFPVRDPADRELQPSNLFLAKAWFLSDQRMTRSRSSELRRRYTEMQNAQAAQGIEAICMAPQQGDGIDTMKQEAANLNDKVSSSVSILKDTLQRKRAEKEAADKSLKGIFSPQEPIFQTSFLEGQENWSHQKPVNVQAVSNGQVDHGVLQTFEGSMNFVMDSFANQTNQMYIGTASQEPSQSESSAAAPVVSSGLDACEGPSNSNQTLCESSWKQVGVNKSSENTQNKVKAFREQIMDNLKDDRKRRSLDRYGSISSAVSGNHLFLDYHRKK